MVVFVASLPVAGAGLHFERVGSESGPPAEVITAIHQDRAGFIWIGSRDGLVLYDGHAFRVFEHDAADPTSISDNTIRTIYEDRSGQLWLGTNTGGLNRLDRSSWTFEHFRHDSSNPDSLSHDSVYAILEDGQGDLWIGTQLGLNRLRKGASEFERFLSDPQSPDSLSHDYVYALHEDRDGALWVSTIGGGLNRRDPVSGKFYAYRHDPDDPGTLTSDGVLDIAEDSAGRLWISTMDGLNCLNRTTGRIRRFEYDPDGVGISDPVLTSLAFGPSDQLWIATHGGGLDRLDTVTGEFRNWRHDPARSHSLGSDEVVSLAADASGTLWIGTWGGGLNRVTPSSLLLSETAGVVRMPEGLDVDNVTGLMLDGDGGLWIGTRSGDVVRRDLQHMTDRAFIRGGSAGSSRIVLGFVEGPDGNVWVGSSAGLIRIDRTDGEHRIYAHDPTEPTSIGPGYVKAMLLDRQRRFWVGTGEGGLQQVGVDGQVLKRFLHDPADPASLSDDYVTALCEDRRGTLWIGTRSGGLNAFDPQAGRAVRYLPDAGDENALSHHYVTSIIEDAAGTLWVGTGGGGLNQVELGSDGRPVFTRYSESSGLSDDDVMGLLEDDDGSLWVSTKRGVTRLDPTTGDTDNLSVSDGLPSGEFEAGTAVRDATTLYFGSVKGLVAIPTGTPVERREPSPTVITSVRTAEGELKGDAPAWELQTLNVPWGSWLSLQFAVLDYSAERRHRYAYRLGGSDGTWVALGPTREITFTDLEPGTYEFDVRGRNSQGVWSQATSDLHFRIIPPFWMTNWFRALAGLLVISLVVVGHRWRISAVAKRNRELVALHEQREKAREELGRTYQRLRQLTHRLELAKEDERKHIARELHDEMGPTLTAAIINLQLLERNPASEGASERIEDTIELVDRMVQRVRDLSLDLRPPLLEELGLVPALRGYLEAQAQRAQIEITLTGDAGGRPLSQEAEITAFRVVQEAVTNVLRHAEASSASVTVRRRNQELELAVTDDGRGFNVGDTMDGPPAKALGLLGMQERVHTMGGTVNIHSDPGSGTEVRVRVPLHGAP